MIFGIQIDSTYFWTLVLGFTVGSTAGTTIAHFVSYWLSKRYPQRQRIIEKGELEKE